MDKKEYLIKTEEELIREFGQEWWDRIEEVTCTLSVDERFKRHCGEIYGGEIDYEEDLQNSFGIWIPKEMIKGEVTGYEEVVKSEDELKQLFKDKGYEYRYEAYYLTGVKGGCFVEDMWQYCEKEPGRGRYSWDKSWLKQVPILANTSKETSIETNKEVEVPKKDWTDKHYDYTYKLTDKDIENGEIRLDPYLIAHTIKLGDRDNSGILFHILKTIFRWGTKNTDKREKEAIIKQANSLERFY